MNNINLIKDIINFQSIANPFFQKVYGDKLGSYIGEIEVRTFPPDRRPEQYFCGTTKEAVDISLNLCNSGIDAYIGVNPRVGKVGKKENRLE